MPMVTANLTKELGAVLELPLYPDVETRRQFVERLAEGKLTRPENAASHFCVFFMPFDPAICKVFFVHHKKAGLWIAPGGHIEPGESICTTLNREILEELGVRNFFAQRPQPFLFTIKHITDSVRPCRVHYDIWYLMKTDGRNFAINQGEFHDARWLSVAEAHDFVTDRNNLLALEKLPPCPSI